MKSAVSLILTPLTLVNTLVLAVIGAAFGYAAGNVVVWLIGGALAGLVLALAVEVIFQPLRNRPRLFRRRMLILVLGEALLAVFVIIPAYTAYTTVYPIRYPVTVSPAD